MKRILVALAGAFLLSSCAELGVENFSDIMVNRTSFSVIKKSMIGGELSYAMKPNFLADFKDGECKFRNGNGILMGSMRLGLSKLIADGKDSYYLNFEYRGRDWVFIDSNLGMILYLDGKKTEFKAVGDINREVLQSGVGGIFEQATYSVKLDQIKSMIEIKDVKFRVYAKNGVLEYCLPEYAQANFKSFLEYKDEPKAESKKKTK